MSYIFVTGKQRSQHLVKFSLAEDVWFACGTLSADTKGVLW